jgi:hypothetical protein
MFASEVFIMPSVKTGYADLIPWLLNTAILQEAHHFHSQNWPDWVPGAKKFRGHAEALTIKGKAAENKDRERAKERDQEYADAMLSIRLNANYIVMRSLYEKDESLLYNVGYVLREKTRRSYGQTLSAMPLVVKLKNGPDIASVAVRWDRDPAAALYLLQICKGEPAGEDSWMDEGTHKSCRVIVRNLDRASWCYFRVRSIGDNESGPWSAPVGIIVV